ncbi:ThuA domain-containing protein [Persicitalea sp.]|uniref:ThuA domain-containing protein n=1 Tax=Persicitalea sp. TaxID=3100273 RepID=UPI003593F850
MKKKLLLLTLLIFATRHLSAQQVLMVADEFPAMEILAKGLQEQEGLISKIIAQTDLPDDLSGFQAVVVYIHKDLDTGPEEAFIRYAEEGGKLIVLHHSISSGKRKNKEWFSFLGLELPQAEEEAPAYKYIDDMSMDIVNLAPKHFITTHKVAYPQKIKYQSEGTPKYKNLPGFNFPKTEVYLNHHLITPRTVLLGFKFIDPKGNEWMQDRSAWWMKTGKGSVFCSQAGHYAQDFADVTYARILANAVIYKPE